MARRIFVIICFICLASSMTAYANSPEPSIINSKMESISDIFYLENGACVTRSIPVVIYSQRGSLTGQTTYRFRDSNGVILWTATLTGTFAYNGSTATCTAASCETSVQQGNWHETYNHAYPSGNTAQADITMVRKVLFITVQTETAHLVLTCDANGNLS